jgi:hypothetical protein
MSRTLRPLLALALLAGSMLALAACAEGEDDRTAGIIERLLQAAVMDDTGDLESFPGELPPGLPIEPPLYPGAEIIVSNRQPAPVGGFELADASGDPYPLLYFILLDSTASRDDVLEFYEVVLDEDPWQLESSFSTGQLDTLQFFNVEDVDIAGAVTISHGGEDGRTSVLISLQDAGAFLEEEATFEPDESLRLPKEFPPDMPLYPEATITGTAFFREPGGESFLLIFLTTDSQDAIIEFYRDEFDRRFWTVLAGEPIGLEERLDFRDAEGGIQGDVLADRYPRSRRYTEVRIQILTDPAREPVEIGDAPTPEPTEEGEGDATPDEAEDGAGS